MCSICDVRTSTVNWPLSWPTSTSHRMTPRNDCYHLVIITVTSLSHTYAVKSRLVTMARPKFVPKSTPSCGSIPKPHYLPHPWTRPTYDPKRHQDPIRRFPQCTGQTDRPTHRRTNRPTDRPRESLTTIGRYARRATRPNSSSNRLMSYLTIQQLFLMFLIVSL